VSDTRGFAATQPVNVAVGYCRVSTEQQLDGLSLAWQRSEVERAVTEREWALAGVLDEQASAKTRGPRPVLSSLLKRLDGGEFDVLVVAKLDRLARSMLDFYSLLERARKHGWSVVCLSPALDMTTSQGRMVAGMSMLFAEYEREIMGDRQRESIAARRRAGTYKPTPKQLGDDVEDRIAHLAAEGFGARRIARQLELEGYRPPRAARWQPSTVQVALRRLRASEAA
jgi:DNA invertase Pin-like site-specific DNA recombinase